MKYVLDSNVALKWVLPETDDDEAIRIRDEFGQGIHQLLSPAVTVLARFARALHTAIKKGRGDPTFSPREKVPRRGG